MLTIEELMNIPQREYEGAIPPQNKVGGLYLIGTTYFNPFTDEKFYWLKIGTSINLINRIKQYNSHSPMIWKIDFLPEASRYELRYHQMLGEFAIEKGWGTDEWFRVSRPIYLAICEKGFAFFPEITK